MKRVFLIFLICICVTGCVNVNKSNIDQILTSCLNSELELSNTKKNGYNYYLPKGMKSLSKTDYNEIISDGKYNFYMYIDVQSYYNKVVNNYIKKSTAYYSNAIKYEDKFGYLEINKQNSGKYLIEIMYNYAKIEVMVEECDINNVVSHSISILSSIKFNDAVINNALGDNVLSSTNELYNIFETAETESKYLDYVEKYDNYDNSGNQDNDFIK